MEYGLIAAYLSAAAGTAGATVAIFHQVRSAREKRTSVNAKLSGCIDLISADGRSHRTMSCDLSDRSIIDLETTNAALFAGYPSIAVANQSQASIFVERVDFVSARNPRLWPASISAAGCPKPPGQIPYKLDPKQRVAFTAPRTCLAELLMTYDAIRVATSDGFNTTISIPHLNRLRKRLKDREKERRT